MSTSGNGGFERSPIDFYRVPEEVIKAWERGEYFTGNVPSLAYKYLGVALGLRGLYTYTGKSPKKDFKGVAKIDLKGQELVMTGVRLWDEKDRPDIKFWRTEFSHFLSHNKIIWTYVVFNDRSDADLFSQLNWKKLPAKTKTVGSRDRFGFSEEDWNKLLKFLLSPDFTATIENIESRSPEIIRVMLHFAKIEEAPRNTISAEYRRLDQSGSDIAGDSHFERIIM
jgi:hypothetical protein